MNIRMLNILLTLVLALCSYSCKNDWTIKDVPPIPEAPQGSGYVAGFENEGEVAFAIEVPADGTYSIAVSGRGTTEGTPGTGQIAAAASSAQLQFSNYGSWSEQIVQLELKAGVNDVVISAGSGNGLFHIDYIELQ